MIKTILCRVATLTLFVSLIACQQETPDAPVAASDPPSTAASPTTTPARAESEPVAYEPAYPADVSDEGLSNEDVTQQETEHTHDGGEPHTHDDGSSHDAEEHDGDHDH